MKQGKFKRKFYLLSTVAEKKILGRNKAKKLKLSVPLIFIFPFQK